MAAKGGALAEITVGDVLELLEAETDALGGISEGSTLFYRMLHDSGILGQHAPRTLRHLRTTGQRTPGQMIDRYHLTCRPVADLLVEYLKERQPALDYNSLESLAYLLGKCFWADLEAHHPGIHSLRLPAGIADAWKARLGNRPQKTTSETGDTTETIVPRLSYRECLTPIRAFCLDLAYWATEDPQRWGAWVAPSPIGAEEGVTRKAARQTKSRMDARTRQRLPVLPLLVRAIDARRNTALNRPKPRRGSQPSRAR